MRLFSLIGIVALFLGSLGIPMYEHYCAHEEITIHTLFSESEHCEPEADSHKDTCCSKEKERTIQRKNCCSDELKNLSLTFNYFEKLQKESLLFVGVIPEPPVLVFEQLTYFNDDYRCFPDVSDPPPPGVHERLALVGCWRL